MVQKRHAPCDRQGCRRRHRCQAAKLAASRSSQPRRPRQQWQRNQQQLNPAARRCRAGSCGYRRLCRLTLGNMPLLLSATLHQRVVPLAVAAGLATPFSSSVSKRRSVAALSCTVPCSCAAHARQQCASSVQWHTPAWPQARQQHSRSCVYGPCLQRLVVLCLCKVFIVVSTSCCPVNGEHSTIWQHMFPTADAVQRSLACDALQT